MIHAPYTPAIVKLADAETITRCLTSFNFESTVARQPDQSNNLAAYSWSIADLLRGGFKQRQYGRIILPFAPA